MASGSDCRDRQSETSVACLPHCWERRITWIVVNRPRPGYAGKRRQVFADADPADLIRGEVRHRRVLLRRSRRGQRRADETDPEGRHETSFSRDAHTHHCSPVPSSLLRRHAAPGITGAPSRQGSRRVGPRSGRRAPPSPWPRAASACRGSSASSSPKRCDRRRTPARACP